MDVQIRNQGAAVNTGIAQPAFSLWMSHGITVSLRGAVRWIRSPPVPQAALWGSCSCFCRAEVRDVTVVFCTWGGNAVLTLQSHISAKSRPLLAHTLFEQQNTTAALRRKKAVVFFFFFFPLRKLFLRAKSFCILPVRKGSAAFGTGLCLLLEEPMTPFSVRKLKLGIKRGFQAIFHCYLWAALQDYVKWRTATDVFDNTWGVREVLLLSGKKAERSWWWAGGGHIYWLTPRHSRAGENHSWCVLLSSQQPVITNWLTARYWWISLEKENKNVEIFFFIVNLPWTLRDSPPIYNPVWSSRKPVLEVSHERELCFYLTKALWIFSHFLFDLSVNFLHPLPLLPFWSS